MPEICFLLRRLFNAVFFPLLIAAFMSATYDWLKKDVLFISKEGESFPNFTQLRPVAVEIDSSLHSSDNERKSSLHAVTRSSDGFAAVLGITHTLLIICAPAILPSSQSFCTRRSDIWNRFAVSFTDCNCIVFSSDFIIFMIYDLANKININARLKISIFLYKTFVTFYGSGMRIYCAVCSITSAGKRPAGIRTWQRPRGSRLRGRSCGESSRLSACKHIITEGYVRGHPPRMHISS